MADTMTRLSARLRLVTDSTFEFERAQETVFRIANENGQQLQAVGELYVRLGQSIGDVVDRSGQLETITQAVTQSMRVSGATQTESAGAIRQLSQAFASGVLRGDEFNSVNEQAPRIMQALADSLGITRGELRAMAEQGQITADVLRTALIEQAGAIAAESAQIPITVSEAWTTFRNSVLDLVAAFDEASGGSQSLATIIQGVAVRIGNAADWIRDRMLNIRLAGIAMVRGLLLAFEDLRGGFEFLRIVAGQVLQGLENRFNAFVAGASDGIARVLEISAAAADFVPGLGGAAQQQLELAAGLRANASLARENTVEVMSLGEAWSQTRGEVEANKNQIRAITDEMADSAIAAAAAARANAELAEEVDNAGDAADRANGPTKELIETYDAFKASLSEQAESLREQLIQLQGGTEALIEHRIAKLAAAGATPEMINALRAEKQAVLDAEKAYEDYKKGLERDEAAKKARESFEALKAELLAQKGAYELTGDALRAFQREQFILEQLARLGTDATEDQIQSIRDLAGEAFDAADELRGLAGAIQDYFDTILSPELSRGIALSIEQGIADGINAINADDILDGNFGEIAKSFGQSFLQSAGEGIGLALSGGNPIGGRIGALIGDIIGTAVFSGGVPKAQIRGSNAQRATDVGTDTTFQGALGELNFGFRKIEDEAQRQFERAFLDFDTTMASIIRDQAQLDRVIDRLSREGLSTRSDGEDIEGLLSLRFDAILSTFDPFIQGLVGFEGKLEDRVQALNDILFIQQEVGLGRGLGITAADAAGISPLLPPATGPAPGAPGLPPIDGGGFSGVIQQAIAAQSAAQAATNDLAGFNAVIEGTGEASSITNPALQATLTLVKELQIPGETLAETFDRLRMVAMQMDITFALTGKTFGETRQDVIRFGADLAEAMGGVDRLGSALNNILGTIYSEAERLEVDVAAST